MRTAATAAPAAQSPPQSSRPRPVAHKPTIHGPIAQSRAAHRPVAYEAAADKPASRHADRSHRGPTRADPNPRGCPPQPSRPQRARHRGHDRGVQAGRPPTGQPPSDHPQDRRSHAGRPTPRHAQTRRSGHRVRRSRAGASHDRARHRGQAEHRAAKPSIARPGAAVRFEAEGLATSWPDRPAPGSSRLPAPDPLATGRPDRCPPGFSRLPPRLLATPGPLATPGYHATPGHHAAAVGGRAGEAVPHWSADWLYGEPRTPLFRAAAPNGRNSGPPKTRSAAFKELRSPRTNVRNRGHRREET